MSKERILYVDDEEKALREISQDLMEEGMLEVCTTLPPKSPEQTTKLVAGDWGLYLLDYVLNMRQDDGQSASYKGGTLASALREAVQEHPIVVLSRKNIVPARDERLVEHLKVFDARVFKEEIASRPQEVARELRRLSEGFRKLRQCEQRDWGGLLSLLEANRQEGEQLGEAFPPLSDVDGQVIWDVLGVGDWLNNTVFKYPGILVDALHTATLLGITECSFQIDKVRALFQDAEYSGVMAPVSGRWWRSRVLGKARGLTRRSSTPSFREAFQLETGIELDEAKCIHCGQGPADWVCYVLKEPVMIEHSLAYRPDDRPRIMEEARVSFKAIVETNDVRDEFFDRDDLEMAKLLRQEAQKA